ncbi:TlpA disulfide reductase family protein [Thalassotalea eurytherma]|uniref:Thioredoxin domain-containing protein n=1 Tax=Thalassotalea eurytherma TaxID=1144278 RepID=A0ABQ6H574_9GAMM|nr:TlpA disulfide reductase family protein [Thalassotalea eurytherma]GLX83277.1 hypothetical protein theurythT_27290 [Thalassotalea eurytherma]
MKLIQSFIAFMFLFSCSSIADTNSQLNAKLASLRGQVVYVDFWASWCGPCRESFPWLNEMQAIYKDQGFSVVSVNVDAQKSFALEFLATFPADFEVIYDPKGKIARKYDLRGMPSSFIVDRQGQVVATHVGFNDTKKQQYQQEILSLLALAEDK